MQLLNLLQINPSDDQTTVVDGINFNFDQILSMGGGPPGNPGIQGIQGVPGSQGIQGLQGVPGTPGSRWYVQPSSMTPALPAPVAGDFWFQTDTLLVFEFEGSPLSWIETGNLNVALSGPFTYSGNPSSTNNILFSSPTAQRGLVLSSINYGGDDPVGTPNYRLKLVGASGLPLMRFALDQGGSELAEVYQPSIVLQGSGTTFDWTFNNGSSNTGNINVIGSGTSLQLQSQSAGVSSYNFNSTSFQLRLGSSDKLIGFTPLAGAGNKLHIGAQGALATTSLRMFTVNDDGSTGVGDVYNNAISDVAGLVPTTPNYQMDVLGQINSIGTSAVLTANKLARFRNKVITNWDELSIFQMKSFTGSAAQSWSGTEMRIQRFIDSDPSYHFISFHSGAYNTSIVQNYRPQFRLGTGFSVDANNVASGYYLSADQNGFIGLGSSSFVSGYNDSTLPNTYQFLDRLNVLSSNLFAGNTYVNTFYAGSAGTNNSMGGIHLFMPQNWYRHGIPVGGAQSALSDMAGITVGNSNVSADQNFAAAGVMFQSQLLGTNLYLATSPNSSSQQTRTAIRYDGLQWSSFSPSVSATPISINPTWTESLFVFTPTYINIPPVVSGAGGSKGLTFLTQNPTWQGGYPGLYNHFTFDSGYGVGMELVHYTLVAHPDIAGSGSATEYPSLIITHDQQVTGIFPSHTRNTSFIVDAFGNTAIGRDLLTNIAPALNIAGAEWSPIPQSMNLLAGGKGVAGQIVLSSPAPATSVFTASNSLHIVGSSWSGDSGSPLHGSHLVINPGNVINVFGSFGEGGNLYLRGGLGQQSNGSSIVSTVYGNVILGYDFDNSAVAGNVGIGTNTPAATLDVSGTLHVTPLTPIAANSPNILGPNFTGNLLYYLIDGLGMVHIYGVCTMLVFGGSNIIMTLPVGYRPVSNTVIGIATGSYTNGNIAFWQVEAFPTGIVTLQGQNVVGTIGSGVSVSVTFSVAPYSIA